MRILSRILLCVLSACALSLPAMAAERGTPDEAVALVKQAIAYIKANGRDKGYAAINTPKGQFSDRDLYVFVYDFNGNTKAHGANPKMIGKNLIDLKDADGKFIVKSFIETANKGSGWVDYHWPNPVSGKMEAKSSYVEKFEDILVGCGVYK